MAKTILVADNSSTIRRIVELTFTDSEIRVESAASGREALERLPQIRPDLVLVDAVMPDPTGYDVCRAIKESESPVPVLLLAATFEPYDEALGAECGVDDHLVKPFESTSLREKVERWLAPPPVEPEVQEEPEPLPEPSEPESPDAPAEDESRLGSALEEGFSDELVEALARAVVNRLSTDVLREIAREVVPQLAERIIRERIREIENDD